MRFLACIILLVFVPRLYAEGDGSGSREVYLRLLSFDTETAPEKSYAFDPKVDVPGTEAPIKTYLNHQGTLVRLAGDEVVFSSSNQAADARKPEQQLATVKLPSKGDAFILIFLKIGENKFKVLPLSDSVKDFPLGTIQVISLSKTPIKLVLEKKVFDLKPGALMQIKDAPVGANQQTGMYAYGFEDGKWKRFTSGMWVPPAESKRLIEIFFDQPLSKRTKLKGFRDISPLASENALTPLEMPVP